MADKESNLGRLIMLALSKNPAVRLFRNNVGLGWAGEHAKRQDNLLVLRNPRPLHAGLCEGSSDVIGWKTIEITPEMVGKKVAVFTAIEVKMPGGKISEKQLNFIGKVRESGGIAGIARSVQEAGLLLEKYLL